MPAVFCCLGYLLIWAALQPVWAMGSALVGFLVSSEARNFDSYLTVTYDPGAYLSQDTSEGFLLGDAVHFPEAGEQYGEISCEHMGLDAPVYWYDSNEILDYGVGSSLVGFPPGYGRSIILSAHNRMHFRCLEYAEVGDVVSFSTNWCNYEYTVTDIQVLDVSTLEQLLRHKAMEDNEELIMYTCWPVYAMPGTQIDRLVVFAERTSGLDVKWKGIDG